MSNGIRLIVGLGNPSSEYVNTRHNAGAWLVDAIAHKYKLTLMNESKFFGKISKFKFADNDVFLLEPQTFMNLSGKSLLAVASFYKILPQQILVAHDELDFIAGVIKLKDGGGNGGHNGLRDIDRVIGKNYWRLRIGIGHPGDKNKVADYVLKKPSIDDLIDINNAIDKAVSILDLILSSSATDLSTAMKKLHTV